MIVYYRKSDETIIRRVTCTSKEGLGQAVLEAELNDIFPEEAVDDVGVSIVDDALSVEEGGKWDKVNNVMKQSPPVPVPDPDKVRLKELRDKWAASTVGAKAEEIAEYILKAGL